MDEQLLSDEQRLPSHRGEEEPTTALFAIGFYLLFQAFVACVALFLVSCFALLAWAALMLLTSRAAEFSVAIDGFSGLEDRAPRAFNLTLGVDNLGGTYDVCVGGEAVVLYAGVPLAVGQAQDLCVPPGRAAEVAVAAASGGVGLPRALAELMATERRADGVARVEVRVVSAKYHKLLSCPAALDDEVAARPSYPCKKAFFADETDGVRPDGSSRLTSKSGDVVTVWASRR